LGAVKIGIYFSIVLLGLGAYAQEEEVIPWAPNLRLQWEDFRATPPAESRIAATTASGISYRFSAMETNGNMKVDCTIDTFFYPNESWYQPDVANEIILSHEQLHFDISELFARKMRQRIGAFSFTKKVKAEVKTIYGEILREMRDFQKLYDEETNFSRDVEAQLRWNKKINMALE